MSKLIRTPIDDVIIMYAKEERNIIVDMCYGLNLMLNYEGTASSKLQQPEHAIPKATEPKKVVKVNIPRL